MDQVNLDTSDVGTPQIGLIALGANLAVGEVPPDQTIAKAMDHVARAVGASARRSRLFRTPAFPAGAGPDFVNAAMAVDWKGCAGELLNVLHGIEDGFGRTRDERWGARVMDLDLIALGDAVLPDAETQDAWRALSPEQAAMVVPEQLILPHPRVAERAFVLIPLFDVAPQWVHPATGRGIEQMIDDLAPEDVAAVRLI